MSEGIVLTLSQRVAEGGALPTEALLHAMLPLM